MSRPYEVTIARPRAAFAMILGGALLLAGCQDREAEPDANSSLTSGAAASNEAAAPPATAAPDNEAAAANAAAPAQQASPPPPASAWSASGYTLSGTEPFWGGTISGTRILYQTPENQAGEAVAASATFGPAREVYTGTLGGRPFVLTLTKSSCSNGMSDHNYAYSASLRVNGEARQGCADPR